MIVGSFEAYGKSESYSDNESASGYHMVLGCTSVGGSSEKNPFFLDNFLINRHTLLRNVIG